MFRTLVFGSVAAGLVIASVALAQNTAPIEARQKLLKEIGGNAKNIGDMLKGDKPFDAAIAKASFEKIAANAKQLPSFFPPDSKTGGETAALPKIWDDKAKFEGLYASLATDATAAAAGVTDAASLKTVSPKVFGNCKNCHDEYRAKK